MKITVISLYLLGDTLSGFFVTCFVIAGWASGQMIGLRKSPAFSRSLLWRYRGHLAYSVMAIEKLAG